MKKESVNFKVEINEIFNDSKRDLIITNREIRKRTKAKSTENEKWYKYTCNKCGWSEGWIREYHLIGKQSIGCACCANQIVVPEINSIKTKAPWMIDLGVSEEDAIKYTPSSNKKIKVVCPDCGNIKNIRIGDVYNRKSIGCSCSDKFSYPEKFMISVLTQLGFEFETQLSCSKYEWCGNYRYDFYIPSLNMIIETHGLQHYVDNTNFTMSLEEVEYNDECKRILAENNGINRYVVIDCRKSELEFITANIKKELSKYINVNCIDFNKAESFALSNRIKAVCNYWGNGTKSVSEIVSVTNHSNSTIIEWLKKGAKLGWCDYNPKEEMKKSAINSNILKRKPLIAIKDGVLLGEYESSAHLSRISEKEFGVFLDHRNITSVCRGKNKSYKGYTFKYVNNQEGVA